MKLRVTVWFPGLKERFARSDEVEIPSWVHELATSDRNAVLDQEIQDLIMSLIEWEYEFTNDDASEAQG